MFAIGNYLKVYSMRGLLVVRELLKIPQAEWFAVGMGV
jgi:hypothetical protein